MLHGVFILCAASLPRKYLFVQLIPELTQTNTEITICMVGNVFVLVSPLTAVENE